MDKFTHVLIAMQAALVTADKGELDRLSDALEEFILNNPEVDGVKRQVAHSLMAALEAAE